MCDIDCLVRPTCVWRIFFHAYEIFLCVENCASAVRIFFICFIILWNDCNFFHKKPSFNIFFSAFYGHKWRIFKMPLKLTSIECSKRFFFGQPKQFSLWSAWSCNGFHYYFYYYCYNLLQHFYSLLLKLFLLLYGFKMQFSRSLFLQYCIMLHGELNEIKMKIFKGWNLFFEVFLKLSEFYDWLSFKNIHCGQFTSRFNHQMTWK